MCQKAGGSSWWPSGEESTLSLAEDVCVTPGWGIKSPQAAVAWPNWKKKKKERPLEVLQRANADEIPEFQATCISNHHISKVKGWLASPATGIFTPQHSCGSS